MDVTISFDTEDYLTLAAADAAKWWADELTARGIRGSFQCVGEAVRAWRRRGREDVIEAVGRHEICIHTNYHSFPPCHPEAIADKTLAEGIDWVRRNEAETFATLAETFGKVPVAYCPPGDSWTPATLLAMAAAGVKVYCGARTMGLTEDMPIWYCGLLAVQYNVCFDNYFGEGDDYEEKFQASFNQEMTARQAANVIGLYSHPTRLVTSNFWDTIWYGARRVPIAESPPAPLWSEAVQQRNKDTVRASLDWLQAREDVRFIDYATLYAERADARRDLSALLAEVGLKPGQEGALAEIQAEKDSFVLAAEFAKFGYGWPVHPKNLDGANLVQQMAALAWTTAPAPHNG